MIFLGLEIDTGQMAVRIPDHKVEELSKLLSELSSKNKITLRQLQSFVGKLSFFSRAICSSRAFLRRFYDAMSHLKKPHHCLRISKGMLEDMRVWKRFLRNFNGITYIPPSRWFTNKDLQLFLDSAGAGHFRAGCYFADRWSYFPWPREWESSSALKDLSFLEMVPVLLALYLWGPNLANKKVSFNIDNEALVWVRNKQSSKSKRLMQLVRPFVQLSMSYNIVFKAVHIASKSNCIADAISRQQWKRFRVLAPNALLDLEAIPLVFRHLISGLSLEDC